MPLSIIYKETFPFKLRNILLSFHRSLESLNVQILLLQPNKRKKKVFQISSNSFCCSFFRCCSSQHLKELNQKTCGCDKLVSIRRSWTPKHSGRRFLDVQIIKYNFYDKLMSLLTFRQNNLKNKKNYFSSRIVNHIIFSFCLCKID